MHTFHVRAVVISVVIGLCLVPAYGHHGNQFLSRAIEASATEVRLATIAAEKSQKTEVKAFAEAVTTDQTEALRELMNLRAARTIVSATPVSTDGLVARVGWGTDRIHRKAGDIPMTPDHRHTFERLSSLPDDEFDRQFISEIVREHRETIAFFEEQLHVHGNEVVNRPPRDAQDYSPEELLKDVDTVDFAIGSLPSLRLRLKQAEALQKLLQKR